MNTPKSEFADLKKVIASYIEKYDSPTRKGNHENLELLIQLREEMKTDQSKEKEFLALRDKITLSNGGFGMKYVMKYYRTLNDDVPVTELFQEAIIGLIEAIDTFNPLMDTAFTTYAYFHIRKRLIDFIKHNKLVRAPRDIARNMKHVGEAQEYLYSQHGYEPTTTEVAGHLLSKKGLKLKESIVENILQLLDLNSCGIEDKFISEYNDQLFYEENEGLFKKMELNLSKSLKAIDSLHEDAALLRFGVGRDFPHTPEEIRLLLNAPEQDFVI